jgi:hypothetical protein
MRMGSAIARRIRRLEKGAASRDQDELIEVTPPTCPPRSLRDPKADYTIVLTGRVRQETRTKPLWFKVEIWRALTIRLSVDVRFPPSVERHSRRCRRCRSKAR